MKNSTYDQGGRKRDKSRKGLGVALLVLFCGVLWFCSFFRVREVEVAGSTHYSDEQVKDIVLRGPLAGNAVLAPIFCSREHTGEISFIDAIEVSYVDSGSILIGVKEKQSIGCVRYLDCYVYFDREGMAIESSVERDEGVPYYEGMEMDHICLDQPLPVKDKSFFRMAVSLFQILPEHAKIPDSIRIDGRSRITLVYGSVQVDLGKDQHLDDKISRMSAILPQLEGRSGILHLESVTPERQAITFES